MPLFRRASPTAETAEPVPLTEVDALVGIAVAAVYSDGVIGAVEHDLLMDHVGRLAICKNLDQRDLRAMFARIEELAGGNGDDALIEECVAALPARLRGTAYFLAADILHGDDEVGTDEVAFLGRLQKALQVDDAEARKIREVVALKYAC